MPGRLGLVAEGFGVEVSQADISEVLIYNRALTKVERHDVGRYLAQKYGLATTYLDSSTFANFGSASAFTGADPGEGLDLEGNLVYTVNVGGPSVGLGDRVFSAEAFTPGVTVAANNVIPFWATRPEYGGTDADNGLETVMHGIRYSGGGDPINDVTIDMDVTPGDT